MKKTTDLKRPQYIGDEQVNHLLGEIISELTE